MFSATDVHPGCKTAAGRDVASPRQSVLLLNPPDYWKDFPNTCHKASPNASPISSFPCLLLLHLQPKSGPPQTGRKGTGGQHKSCLAPCACLAWTDPSVFGLSWQNLTGSQTPFVYLMPGRLSDASWALDILAVCSG